MDENEDIKKIYKILLLGDSSVGKTCFLLRYTDNTFQEIYMSTIGLDYRLKTVKLPNEKKIRAQIWDTAGQDRFRAITKNYYKGSNGIILIYDVTDKKSFEGVKNWIEQIRDEVTQEVLIYLVGNKIDKKEERKISKEEGKKLADSFGVQFYESSAKTGENIDLIFYNLLKDIDNLYSANEEVPVRGKKISKISKKKLKEKCCL